MVGVLVAVKVWVLVGVNSGVLVFVRVGVGVGENVNVRVGVFAGVGVFVGAHVAGDTSSGITRLSRFKSPFVLWGYNRNTFSPVTQTRMMFFAPQVEQLVVLGKLYALGFPKDGEMRRRVIDLLRAVLVENRKVAVTD
jgi:hypothetical protein